MPSKYADAHKSTNGPGDARPTALQIARDEGLTAKMADKVFLITGCSSGIGVETAKALATTGAKLYLTARNITAAEKALASILKPGQVEIIEMDLSSLAGVKSGVDTFLAKSSTLNVLICNAGVMAIPDLTRTVDGFETHFAVNHLAHFFLFQQLEAALLTSSSPSFHSRVVMVSSTGHQGGGIRPDDYNYVQRPQEYDAWTSYFQSKTANIYMANEIDRRYGAQGLHGLSLTPGTISSGIQRHLPKEESAQFARENWKKFKSPEQGAATTVFGAVSKEIENVGAVYLENCEVAGPYVQKQQEEYDHGPDTPGYAGHAFNKEMEHRLWVDSLSMIAASKLSL
ncbi:hypothetical protein O1611_g79 [Lasiodiplodia mahajangana]|uniref:Uncharacterized protein n=1 Tax=Lasiodiplodia mahajangana TaxID=1108764 RepID=A0ACC2K184_9PEZI|nr:hypothetical protein O1611_g79 [Lasiodiplodia mahajangana]